MSYGVIEYAEKWQITGKVFKLFVLPCYSCGVPFAVINEFDIERRRDRRSFYCPNGHSQAYLGENEEDRLRAQLEVERDALAEVREELAKESRRASAYKGEAAKLRNRAHNGVCAFCHRCFANVERHVQSKHAGPVAAAKQAAAAKAER